MSTQYGNDIHFKTPNVIIVFSNMYPDFHQLSEEKWKIFKINRMMELKEVTIYTNRVRINNRMKMIFESDDEELQMKPCLQSILKSAVEHNVIFLWKK